MSASLPHRYDETFTTYQFVDGVYGPRSATLRAHTVLGWQPHQWSTLQRPAIAAHSPFPSIGETP